MDSPPSASSYPSPMTSRSSLSISTVFSQPSVQYGENIKTLDSRNLPATSLQSSAKTSTNKKNMTEEGMDTEFEPPKHESKIIDSAQKQPSASKTISFSNSSYIPQFGRPFEIKQNSQEYVEGDQNSIQASASSRARDSDVSRKALAVQGSSDEKMTILKTFDDTMPYLSGSAQSPISQSTAIYNMCRAIGTWESRFELTLRDARHADLIASQDAQIPLNQHGISEETQKPLELLQIQKIMSCAKTLNELLKVQSHRLVSEIVQSHGNSSLMPFPETSRLEGYWILQIGLHIWLDYLHCWAVLVLAEQQLSKEAKDMPIDQLVKSLTELL